MQSGHIDNHVWLMSNVCMQESSLQTKKQIVRAIRFCCNWPSYQIIYYCKATKYTSKLLDQQLNNMEQLMVQGQQNVSITEKELSELSQMADEALKQKVLVV